MNAVRKKNVSVEAVYNTKKKEYEDKMALRDSGITLPESHRMLWATFSKKKVAVHMLSFIILQELLSGLMKVPGCFRFVLALFGGFNNYDTVSSLSEYNQVTVCLCFHNHN
jgi:hypothetical protein